MRTQIPGCLGLALLLVILSSCSGGASFRGTVLVPGDAAPPFRLHDQFGNSVALSDFSGKVVVLTFLYTHCPDVCPITAEALRRAQTLLGDDAREAEFVAITVDPQRDSVERAHQYSQEMDMLDRWRFLVGSREQLDPIWKSYWLDPIRDLPTHGEDSHNGSNDAEAATGKLNTLNALAESPSPSPVEASVEGYLVSHTAPVFLIDHQGDRRVLFTNLSLDPQPLVHDIRLLIK